MKEKEAIKTFLEWYNKSEWSEHCGPGLWISARTDKEITTDQLLAIYEQETKQYTVGEVWDAIIPSRSWHSRSGSHQKEYTAFAERYHELKKQGRIK